MLNFVNLLHCLSSKPIFRPFFKKVQSDWLLEKLTVNWKKLTANWKKLTAIWKKLTAIWKKVTANWKKLTANWKNLTAIWKKLTANWKKLTAIWKKLTARICCEMTEDHSRSAFTIIQKYRPVSHCANQSMLKRPYTFDHSLLT